MLVLPTVSRLSRTRCLTFMMLLHTLAVIFVLSTLLLHGARWFIPMTVLLHTFVVSLDLLMSRLPMTRCPTFRTLLRALALNLNLQMLALSTAFRLP